MVEPEHSVSTVSSSFQWTAQQVAMVGNQKNTTYILAECDIDVPDSDSEVNLLTIIQYIETDTTVHTCKFKKIHIQIMMYLQLHTVTKFLLKH